MAEGANEFSPAEKARFYRMARRSAGECMAILDVAERTVDQPPALERARGLLNETSAMLTAMIQRRPSKR